VTYTAKKNHSLAEIWNHIETTNSELGKVKEDIAILKTDLKWVKESVDSLDKKQWYIITGIVIVILTEILLKVI